MRRRGAGAGGTLRARGLILRTQVGIVGAGPAGLTLARLLERAGIETVVLEARSRDYVEHRIRAGVLEQGTVDLLDSAGVGERMRREGIVHHGIELGFAGERHRIPLSDLTGGRTIVIYGQTELVKDCDLVAGCDGFHGISRASIPPGVLRTFEREYPYGWLGILAAVAPSSDELVYTHHERGFALLSLRSPELSRLYVQVRNDEDVAEWPDARVWEELQLRVGPLNEGQVLEKGVTGMRSFVTEPMQYGRLYLAGDAAHIVPPTGAKGLNLAIADVKVLAEAVVAWYESGDRSGLDGYSAVCLRRVWRAEHFSDWMTSMLHRDEDAGEFGRRLQLSQLRYVTTSTAAATTLAENYVGLERV